jgi:hypothetical protein
VGEGRNFEDHGRPGWDATEMGGPRIGCPPLLGQIDGRPNHPGLTLSTGAGVDLRDIGARERSNAESDSSLEGIPGNLWDLITEEERGTTVPKAR